MIVNILLILCVVSYFRNTCSSDIYKTYNLESDKVCHQSNRILIKRISASPDGLIVKENTYFDNLSGKYGFNCKFEVETGHKSRGMFVVIQKLQLRKNQKTGECIDYIKFRVADSDVISEVTQINFNLKKNKFPWVKFCGNLSAKRDGSQASSWSSDLSKTGFLSDSDTVQVEIYIDKIPTYNESLEMEVVFTPFTSCKSMWSEFKECGMNKCIKKQSFDDGLVNCPFLNCPDEGGCDVSMIEDDSLPPDLRTKVTLTAVTSIFCSFFLFLGCIWCCRYFEVLCWSANTLLGRPNPVELSPIRQPSPSAPPTDPGQDKDLPPAYETLFPERCKDCEIYM